MKKRIAAILYFLPVALLCAANPLVGRWYHPVYIEDDIIAEFYLEFEDKEFSFKLVMRAGERKDVGTYTYSDKKIKLFYDAPDLPEMVEVKYSLNEDKTELTVKDEDGSNVYTRQ